MNDCKLQKILQLQTDKRKNMWLKVKKKLQRKSHDKPYFVKERFGIPYWDSFPNVPNFVYIHIWNNDTY